MIKGKTNTVTVIVTSAILVILAIAFLTSIVSQTALNTDKTRVESEAIALVGMDVDSIDPAQTYTVANYPTSWKEEDCPLTSVVIADGSGTALTVTTDYVVNATYGTYALKNTTATQGLIGSLNNSYVSYTYCGDGYLNTSWGRSILKTNIGLFAIAIFLIGVLLVHLLLKKED